MTIRFGHYALYQGREFQAGLGVDGTVIIISHDESDLQHDFAVVRPGRYVKRVARSEVSELFAIDTYAEYQGHTFFVSKEHGGRIRLLESIRTMLAADLQFAEVERGVWEKWVSRDDLSKIWEVKTPL